MPGKPLDAKLKLVRIDFHIDRDRAEAARQDYVRSGWDEGNIEVIRTEAALLWSEGFAKKPDGYLEDPARDREIFIVIARLRDDA